MLNVWHKKKGYHSLESSSKAEKSLQVSRVVIVVALLCLSVIFTWQFAAFFKEEAGEFFISDKLEKTKIRGSRSMSTLPGRIGEETPMKEASLLSPNTEDLLSYDSDIANNTKKKPSDNLVTSTGHFTQDTGINTDGEMKDSSGDPDLMDTESEPESDEEPQLLPISGWVFDQDSEPVAGINVTASARRLAQTSSADSLDDKVKTSQTDNSGYFAFVNLPDGEYLLKTEASEVFTSVSSTVRTGVSSVVLSVTGDTGVAVTIRGSVTDEQGGAIAGVRIKPTDESKVTSSDAEGSYSLVLTVDERARNLSIRFSKEGYRDGTQSIQQSKLRDLSGSSFRLDAQLEAKGGTTLIQGVVTDEKNKAIRGASIRLYSVSLQSNHVTISSSDGSFVLDNVEVGAGYDLSVRPKVEYQSYVEEGLAIGKDGLDLAIVLEPLGIGSLRGQMVNMNSESIPNHTLWMRNSAPGANRNQAITSSSDGSFQVDDIPVGEVSLGSQGNPRFSIGGIQLETGKNTTVELILDWGNEELAGLVKNMEGDPVAGAEIKLLWSVQGQELISRSRRQTVTDGSGYFIFTELGPGLHTVIVSAKGHRAVNREVMPTMTGNTIQIKLEKTSS